MAKPDYDTTLARMAGNIAAGLLPRWSTCALDREAMTFIAFDAVSVAEAIVDEVRQRAAARAHEGGQP